MNLIDIARRISPPEPWAEGDNIPWNDPGFSKRMLKEHLSQDHDAASRRSSAIDKQVDWIHREVLSGHTANILDLGCGPGLYLQRLAKAGHHCVGIDFSPASIAYARAQASQDGFNIEYREEDLRTADFGGESDLVMLIFGELNVFPRSSATLILQKACRALRRAGHLLLEVHPHDAIRRRGQQGRSWYSAESGLFLDSPHLCLQENFWDSTRHIATIRYFVIDLAGGNVTRHAQSYQAYEDVEYAAMLADCGFTGITRYASLTGEQADSQNDLMVLVSQKG